MGFWVSIVILIFGTTGKAELLPPRAGRNFP